MCCRATEPARASPHELADAARRRWVSPTTVVVVVNDVADAVERAVEDTPAEGQVVVTGSLYVVGAARAALGVGRSGPTSVR